MMRSPRTAVHTLVVSALIVVVSAFVATGATLHADEVVFGWSSQLDHMGLVHAVARTVVMGGQFWLVGSVLVIVAAWSSWAQRSWRPVLVAAGAVVGLDLALWVSKLVLGRSSPHSGADDVLAGGTSYPSGHAATATLCLLLLAAVLCPPAPRPPRRTVLAVWLCAGAASVLVGGSTLVLGYHWGSDVVGGWLIALWFLLPALRLLRPTAPSALHAASTHAKDSPSSDPRVPRP